MTDFYDSTFSPSDQELFWQLQGQFQKGNSYDFTAFMGTFNAQVGSLSKVQLQEVRSMSFKTVPALESFVKQNIKTMQQAQSAKLLLLQGDDDFQRPDDRLPGVQQKIPTVVVEPPRTSGATSRPGATTHGIAMPSVKGGARPNPPKRVNKCGPCSSHGGVDVSVKGHNCTWCKGCWGKGNNPPRSGHGILRKKSECSIEHKR